MKAILKNEGATASSDMLVEKQYKERYQSLVFS